MENNLTITLDQFSGTSIEKAFTNDIEKGRGVPVGTVSTYKNGSKWKKVNNGEWKPVGEQKSEGKKGIEDNPNFKKWFGDSKVVDDNGKPLKVYHGTSSDFSEFDSSKGAYYFTTNSSYAEKYSNANKRGTDNSSIIPVYLKIDKIKDVDFEVNHQNVDKYLNSFSYLTEMPDGLRGIDAETKEEVYVVFK